MYYVIVPIAILLITAVIIFIRSALFIRISSQDPMPFLSNLPELEFDPLIPAEHLSTVVKIETISHADTAQDVAENFIVLQKHLAKMYPLAHKALSREVVDGHSLLYTWQGRDPSLPPVALMAHQDVVPADENTLDQWTHPPFSGKISEGFIWGRGTQDIKCQLIAIFEAVESLIKLKFQPERTILLAFGHNEEVFGTGALTIVKHLKDKGLRVQAVLDEGGSVYEGVIPGINRLAAMISLAEKGYLSLRLRVSADGGHSSTPPADTAIGILSQAIDRLQSHPFPSNVRTVLPMFKALGPALSPLMRMAFANLWLFGGLIQKRLLSDPKLAATIRTTTAPTIIHAGVKDNVLPGLAEAVVNFRILPGETIADTMGRVQKIVDDERVTLEPIRVSMREPSPVSPTDNTAYHHLVALNNDFFPGSISAPFNMLGGSDAYNFHEISDQVYRFTPVIVQKSDQERVHGINERLSIGALEKMVKYYYQLIQRWSTPGL